MMLNSLLGMLLLTRTCMKKMVMSGHDMGNLVLSTGLII